MKIASATASFLSFASLTASADNKFHLRKLQPVGLPSLAEIAASVDDYSTFFEAVSSNVGIANAMNSSEVNITIFGPSNGAFDALPQELVAALLTPPYYEHLEDLLSYHAVQGAYNSSTLASLDGESGTMINGELLTIEVVNGTVCGSSENSGGVPFGCVSLPDVAASNGIFHGINGVLLPDWVFNNLGDVVASKSDVFTTLLVLANRSGVIEAMQTGGPYTLFAPTDDAFAALPDETLASLLLPENVETLKNILLNHIVPGVIPYNWVNGGRSYTALGGETLNVTFNPPPDVIRINGASFQILDGVDLLASNGIIHTINQVLLPLADNSTSSSPSDVPSTAAPLDSASSSPSSVPSSTSPVDSASISPSSVPSIAAPVASPVSSASPVASPVASAPTPTGLGSSTGSALFSAVTVGLTSTMALFLSS